ncbi:MAG: hypothetical protein WBA74_14115 [Cyclobacteriaceae bacterium]
MKYIIWYDATVGKYCCGDERAYRQAVASTTDNAILAEEFINTSPGLVEKITTKLNNNLIIVK